MRWFIPVLAAVLALAGASASAEELDVLTLMSGRVVEGHYNDKTHTLTFGGKISGGIQIDPADIAKHETKTIADEKAPPAPAPVSAAPAAGVAGGDPQLAKKITTANAIKRSQMQRELASSIDYQKLYENSLTKLQAEQVDLPKKVQALQPRIDRARTDYESAQSRYTYVQQDYDYWNGHYHSGSYAGSSVGDARQQRDRAQQALRSLQDEESKAQKRLDTISKELVDTQAKLATSIEKQAKLKESLEKLEAADAAGKLGGAAP